MGHVGYGDFTPKKPITMWFLIIFMLFSWAAFVIILGKAGSFQLEREHFWQLNDWGKVMEERGEHRARRRHFVDMSEEEMLAAAAAYRARFKAAELRLREEGPLPEDTGFRSRRCCCCTVGELMTDMNRRSVYGIFG